MLLRGEKKLSSNRRLEDVSHPAESSRFYCIRERSSRRSRQNILCCDPVVEMIYELLDPLNAGGETV
jgi:hypothetical protein